MKKVLLLFMFMYIGISVISAQTTATADTDAFANIVDNISISKITDLNFGNIVKPSNSGSVILGLNGIRTPIGVILPSNIGDVSVAQFIVTGFENTLYNTTIPTQIIVINGTNQMIIEDVIHNSNGILINGEDTFGVTGTLYVNSNQPIGLYQGSFAVSVNYQ